MSPQPYVRRSPTQRPGITFLTPSEVAAEMRVSKMTVYRLIQRRELTAVRVGRSFRITEQSLETYLRRRLVGDDET